MSFYLYLTNNLKGIKDLYVSCKTFHFVVDGIHFRINYRVKFGALFMISVKFSTRLNVLAIYICSADLTFWKIL